MSCPYPGCTRPPYPGGIYCSRSHRDNAASAGGSATCARPGCTRAAYPGGSYCSRSHRDMAASTTPANTDGMGANVQGRCQYPNCVQNVHPGSLYCSKVHRDAMNSDSPGLVELASSDPKFIDVSTQFTQKWLHTKSPPAVHKIFKITVPKQVQDTYEAYRKTVEGSRALPEGNQRRRFHGTTRTCNLGENGLTTLCQDFGCSLCGIIRSSFKASFAGSNTPWILGSRGRFGPGIYTSSTSSKSNDYVANKKAAAGLPHKTMLLNKVVVGRPIKLKKSDPNLRKPPGDYDSVIGEPGGSLNYDELIVYDDRAVIPAYLILYG